MNNTIAKDNLESQGRLAYTSNPHLQKLANVMEHPEFRAFYENYLSNWETAKTMLVFMALYKSIENNSDLNPFQKLALLKSMIDNSDTRKQICAASSDFFRYATGQKAIKN
jgi:hypothetical protein